MRSIPGSSVHATERIERSAGYRVYGGEVDKLSARVDELVDAQRRTCPLAGECALSGYCDEFDEAGDGTSGYMGLFGSEPKIEGVDVHINDNKLGCPQPTAFQDVALAIEDEN